MKERLRRFRTQLHFLPRTFSLVRAATGRWTLGWIALLVLQGLLPIATVYLTRALVNGLVELVGNDVSVAAATPVLIWVALMAGLMLFGELLRGFTNWVRTVQGERVKDYIAGLVHEQSMAVDMAFYESPDFFDHLHRARNDAGHRPVALLENLGSLLQTTITAVAMAGVLLSFGLLLPIALIISTLPALYVVIHHRLLMHQWQLESTAHRRRNWYYDWLLTERETAAELRLFGLGERFKYLYQNVCRTLRNRLTQLVKRRSLAEFGAALAAMLVTGLAMIWMVWQTARGRQTLGDLALLYQAFSQGQRLMRTLLANVGDIYSNSLFLGNLFEFLDMTPGIQDPAQPAPMPHRQSYALRFDHISFRYPGTDRLALDELDLKIHAGQTAAIVGTNGAGKTTLLKLLCRFYDPQSGCIRINDTDIREFAVADLRQQISVLFQEPIRFNATLAENITMGSVQSAPGPNDLNDAIAAAGAGDIVQRLPDGYNTRLGKWFDGGTDLSAGEWRRIALARAFLRQAPVIILDEPTSFMDSWAQADWLTRFRTLTRGRTALVITHSFTTAMHADIIHVMDAGRIVESGTHDQLISLDGRYAWSWRAQYNQEPTTSTNPAIHLKLIKSDS
jgi:ATP-binding cassette subfamily B protein